MLFIYTVRRECENPDQYKRPAFVLYWPDRGSLFGSEEPMKAPDRRVERTRQLLEAALLSLIKEKEFEAISVQEIIDRANVGRATFYAHYDNKEDLLESGFDGLLTMLRE